MKYFLIILLVMLTACSSQNLIEKPTPEVKKEMPLWQVLQFKERGEKRLEYEDDWYTYAVDFEYATKGQFDNKNMIYGTCPIDSARFTIIDKDSKAITRNETYTQTPCDPCHRR